MRACLFYSSPHPTAWYRECHTGDAWYIFFFDKKRDDMFNNCYLANIKMNWLMICWPAFARASRHPSIQTLTYTKIYKYELWITNTTFMQQVHIVYTDNKRQAFHCKQNSPCPHQLRIVEKFTLNNTCVIREWEAAEGKGQG